MGQAELEWHSSVHLDVAGLGSWSGSRQSGACFSGAMERLTMNGMWPPKDPHTLHWPWHAS